MEDEKMKQIQMKLIKEKKKKKSKQEEKGLNKEENIN